MSEDTNVQQAGMSESGAGTATAREPAEQPSEKPTPVEQGKECILVQCPQCNWNTSVSPEPKDAKCPSCGTALPG